MIAGAAVALVFGWLGADPTLMWVSIGASVAAAVMLALGFNRSRVEVAAATRALNRRPERRPEVAGDGAPPPEAEPEDDEEEEDLVVALPDRRRFHKPECRYAKVPGGVEMTASTARSRGYNACGICKP